MGMFRLAAHLTTLGAVKQRSRKQRVAQAELDELKAQNRALGIPDPKVVAFNAKAQRLAEFLDRTPK